MGVVDFIQSESNYRFIIYASAAPSDCDFSTLASYYAMLCWLILEYQTSLLYVWNKPQGYCV
jgi:hypothetical protein